ncbi:hypothetical protein [Allomuricauda sp. SCSIO 65647]|uniref:hypothetical protein n=1 Tax=Allomuricauda sp. SCSIO 65647 TaxID=2908843 RepID=UPI001F482D7D|nr:hypothetical protein [Muricauda sp. SCSIO 65647]UJH68660.1 hypothetical protein L0P89_05455 [Muricauda sp. SCSIO 65647]
MMKNRLTIVLYITMTISVGAQNPTAYTAEKTDNTSASFNLKNSIGFWHLSGPRIHEGNGFSIFWNNGTYNRYMTIVDNGNIGIGTSTPQSKLDVRSGLRVATDNSRYLSLNSNGDGNAYVSYSGGASNSRIGFQIDGSSKMSIMNNGSIGIGTTNVPSGYKLAVDGKVIAEEIKVETGWADYVFREGYDLPTLEEVEKHIKEKGHLINIPSAKEVEENGVQLGEMNKLLLEKIEELTLYILHQDKEIKRMKTQIKKIVQNQE